MSFEFQTYRGLQNIANLQSSWKQLHNNCINPSIYNQFEFIFQSLKHFNYPKVQPFILSVHFKGELIALFFLQNDIEIRMGLKVRVLEFCALDEIDKPNPVIHINHEDRAWQGLFAYLNSYNQWDVLSFIEQPNSNLNHLTHLANQHGMIHRINPDKEGPILNLNKDWDEFWQDHKKMRKKIYKIKK